MLKENFRRIRHQKNSIYYQFIDNKSKKTVVFIHGLFSTSSIFRHFIKFLKYNIILMELRGVVWSKCKEPYLENYVEDLKLILDKENIKKATLVGYSLGCSIANEFAEKYDKRVDKAILLAPINRDLKEIGIKGLIKKLIMGLGKDFFKKWKEYLRLEKSCSPFKIFGFFNFKLLKYSFQKIIFTKKCKIVILNGNLDTFFDPQDINLKLPNIIHTPIKNLDHFLFLRKKRIEKIAKHLITLIQPA